MLPVFLSLFGQSKNPPAVQPHLKKLFDNIKSLRLQKASIGSKTEATFMISSEGEEVQFSGALTLEGPVEVSTQLFSKTIKLTNRVKFY